MTSYRLHCNIRFWLSHAKSKVMTFPIVEACPREALWMLHRTSISPKASCVLLQMGAPYATAGLAYPPQYLPPQLAAQQEQLRQFWQGQMQEIHQVGTDPAEFKNHQLPLARIKKVCLRIQSGSGFSAQVSDHLK